MEWWSLSVLLLRWPLAVPVFCVFAAGALAQWSGQRLATWSDRLYPADK